MKFALLTCSFFLLLLLNGCSSKPIPPSKAHIDQQTRQSQLLNLTDWKIKGKLAIITPDERDSANFFWQQQQQDLHFNVTTSLGINVFKLDSISGIHQLEIEGKNFSGTDLDHLIVSLTGLNLPLSAMPNWVKALPYHQQDKIRLDPATQLPLQLSSSYRGEPWQVWYSDYQQIDGHWLATNLTIVKKDLKIKLRISQWEL